MTKIIVWLSLITVCPPYILFLKNWFKFARTNSAYHYNKAINYGIVLTAIETIALIALVITAIFS